MDIKTALTQCKLGAFSMRSKNTARTYGNGIDCFTRYLATQKILPSEPLEKITVEHFIEFPSWLLSLGTPKGTVQVYLSGAKYLMDWLVLRDSIAPTYRETVRYHLALDQVSRRHSSKFVRTPQKGAVEKILQAAREQQVDPPIYERDIALVEFLASTGCRNNEVANLYIKDIDLSERSAIVTGKGNKDRKVFFNQETAKSLRLYWTVRGFSDGIHPTFARHDKGTGKRHEHVTTTTIRNIVDDLVTLAGLDKGSFTPHYFRHAYAIKMLHETQNLALVQDLLGHKDPGSTRVYAKIDSDDLKKAYRDVFG